MKWAKAKAKATGKDGGAKKRWTKEATRATATKVLAQGAVGQTQRAFGAHNGNRTLSRFSWDAFNSAHAALPRAVGPYTVVRTSAILTLNRKVSIIGTFGSDTLPKSWSTVAMIEDVDSSLGISAANNARVETVPFPGLTGFSGSGMHAVPSAISVQIMNPASLQTTTGLVLGAVCPLNMDLRDRTSSWDAMADDFVSFMKPRVMTAGKLSLRGVKASSYPLDMNAVSDFRPMTDTANAAITWSGTSAVYPEGWAPIVIVNEDANADPPLALKALVCVEWRVRFDIGNPACAAHTNHGVSTDGAWAEGVARAESLGHGIADIVEDVAAGAAAYQGVRYGAAALLV